MLFSGAVISEAARGHWVQRRPALLPASDGLDACLPVFLHGCTCVLQLVRLFVCLIPFLVRCEWIHVCTCVSGPGHLGSHTHLCDCSRLKGASGRRLDLFLSHHVLRLFSPGVSFKPGCLVFVSAFLCFLPYSCPLIVFAGQRKMAACLWKS